jgi:hypothetical protein
MCEQLLTGSCIDRSLQARQHANVMQIPAVGSYHIVWDEIRPLTAASCCSASWQPDRLIIILMPHCQWNIQQRRPIAQSRLTAPKLVAGKSQQTVTVLRVSLHDNVQQAPQGRKRG